MFAMKMFLVAIMVVYPFFMLSCSSNVLRVLQAVTGHDLAWQEKHTSWCYTMALWGQIFFMTSLGYTSAVIFDILFILGSAV